MLLVSNTDLDDISQHMLTLHLLNDEPPILLGCKKRELITLFLQGYKYSTPVLFVCLLPFGWLALVSVLLGLVSGAMFVKFYGPRYALKSESKPDHYLFRVSQMKKAKKRKDQKIVTHSGYWGIKR